jgi:CBS domain-containing protein
MLISDLVRTNARGVITLPAAALLSQAAALMTSEGIGAIVVVNGAGGLEGVLAERDIVIALSMGGRLALGDAISSWMRRGPPTIGPAARVLEAMDLITAARARHLPVVADGKVVGLLSVGDLLKSRLEEKTEENLVLQDVARWPHVDVA